MEFNNNLIIQFLKCTPTSDDYLCTYPISCNILAIFVHELYHANSSQWQAMVNILRPITNTHFQLVCKNADKQNAYGRPLYILVIGS